MSLARARLEATCSRTFAYSALERPLHVPLRWLRSPRARNAFVLASAFAFLPGCRGWARAQVGEAFNLADRPGQSGPYVALDSAFAPKRASSSSASPLSIGGHTQLEAILAPERTSIGWGTGVAFFTLPRPVSPYAIAGTSLHFDRIGDRFSFGNFSPYGELGITASVPARFDELGQSGSFVSLGIAGASYFNYLVGHREAVDGLVLIKLGAGFESQ